MGRRWGRTAGWVAGVAVLVVAGTAGGAVAGHQITSRQIKNHTIKGVDVHKNTLTYGTLTKQARKKLRGSPGPRGAVGPSHLYDVVMGTTTIPLNSGDTEVLSLAVPAGTYFASAPVEVVVSNEASGARAVSCRLGVPSQGIWLDRVVGQWLEPAPSQSGWVTLQGPLTLTSAGKVTISCTDAGLGVQVMAARLDLLRVGAVN